MLVTSKSTLLAYAALTSYLSTAAADCYSDGNWNVFLNVGKDSKTGYWADVKEDGTFTDLYYAQCLKVSDHTCVPCKSLQVVEVGVPDRLACTMTFPRGAKRSEHCDSPDGCNPRAHPNMEKENKAFAYLDSSSNIGSIHERSAKHKASHHKIEDENPSNIDSMDKRSEDNAHVERAYPFSDHYDATEDNERMTAELNRVTNVINSAHVARAYPFSDHYDATEDNERMTAELNSVTSAVYSSVHHKGRRGTPGMVSTSFDKAKVVSSMTCKNKA